MATSSIGKPIRLTRKGMLEINAMIKRSGYRNCSDIFTKDNYQVIKKENLALEECDWLYSKEAICNIKLTDLLQEMANVNKSDINYFCIELVPDFLDNDITNSEDLNEKMKYWGTNLHIKYANGKEDHYKYLHLFDNVNDIQADGKTLLEHASPCSREYEYLNIEKFMIKPIYRTVRYTKNFTGVILDKDIENIICHIDLKYCFSKDSDFNPHDGIGLAVLSCINKEKTINNHDVNLQLKLSLY